MLKKKRLDINLSLLVIISFIIIQIFHFIIIPLTPGFDESWQLQAAVRLISGDGLTSSMDDLSLIRIGQGELDFSKNIYNYLTNWPPLYSLLISIFLFLFSPSLSIGIIKLIFWLIGILGWNIFINKEDVSVQKRSLFLLFIAFFSTLTSGTSMFVWALFPYIINGINNIYFEKNIYKNAVIISLMIAVSVGLRYQMLLFLPSSIFAYLLFRKKLSVTIILSLISVIPATIIYLIILHLNRLYGVDLFTNIKPFSIQHLLSLPKALPYLLPHIILGKNIIYNTHYLGIKIVLTISINIIFIYSIILNIKNRANVVISKILFAFGIVTFLQLSMGGDYMGYNIVLISRYWIYLNPLFIFLIINANYFRDKWKRVQIIFSKTYRLFIICSIMLISIYSILNFKKSSINYYKNYTLYTQYIEDVISQNKLDKNMTIFFTGMMDPNGLYRIIMQDNKYPVFRRLDILNNEDVFLSGEEKLVLMVHDSVDWKNKIAKKWQTRLLDKSNDYSIYLLN